MIKFKSNAEITETIRFTNQKILKTTEAVKEALMKMFHVEHKTMRG